MFDLFIVSAMQDEPFVKGLTGTLSYQGLRLGQHITVQPKTPILHSVDSGLAHCRFGLIVVSCEFLALKYERKALDALAGRSRVVSLLLDATERDVAMQSPKLAISAIPGSMLEHLVRRLKAPPPMDPSAGTNGPPAPR